MLDVQALVKKLNQREITTKELHSYGFTNYAIQKSVEQQLLRKLERGKYLVVQKEKEWIRNQTFMKFIGHVFHNEFEKAYDVLLINIEHQTNHDYDNHNRCYLILLREILQINTESKEMGQLLEFSESSTNTYYQYFIQFRNSVISSHFEDALKFIRQFKQEEYHRTQHNNISTKLFSHLVSEVCRRHQLKNQKEQFLQCKKHYYEFLKYYNNNEYENALEEINLSLSFTDRKHRNNLENYQKLLCCFINLQKEKICLPEKSIDYSQYQEDHNSYLNQALLNEDYLTALQVVNKCLENHKDSISLKLYQNLLHKIVLQNFKNQEETKPKEELTMSLLNDFIYNREYEKSKKMLEENRDSQNRVYYFVLEMLCYFEKISEKSSRYTHTYFHNSDDLFGHFFEAMRYQDYKEAYLYVEKCQQLNKDSNDLEFYIYQNILQDIVEKIHQLEILQDVDSKIKKYSFQSYLTQFDLNQLHNLCQEKIKYTSDTMESKDAQYMIELIDMIDQITKERIHSADFETFEYSDDIYTNFYHALSQGDYLSANAFMFQDKWYQVTQNVSNKTYLILYKKLLIQIRNLCNRTESVSSPLTQDIIEIPIVEQYQHLAKLIKKRNYVGAFQYYMENDFSEVPLSLKQLLEDFLILFKTRQEREAEELLEQYKYHFNRGDMKRAKIALESYQQYIAPTALNRNIDHHFARIESREQEIVSPDFVLKEQLYDASRYYANAKQYEKALSFINHYIELDQDKSAKGYLLRGRIEEYSKMYQQAKLDYQRAYEIIPEPNALLRLGRIAKMENNYEKALQYGLLFEQVRPQKVEDLFHMSELYYFLGDKENSEKYKKMKKYNEEKI